MYAAIFWLPNPVCREALRPQQIGLPYDTGREADSFAVQLKDEQNQAELEQKSPSCLEKARLSAPQDFQGQRQGHLGSLIALGMQDVWTEVCGIAAWLVICLAPLPISHPPCACDPKWLSLTNLVTPTGLQYDCCSRQGATPLCKMGIMILFSLLNVLKYTDESFTQEVSSNFKTSLQYFFLAKKQRLHVSKVCTVSTYKLHIVFHYQWFVFLWNNFF